MGNRFKCLVDRKSVSGESPYYGKGAYFARHAFEADFYARRDMNNGICTVLLCKLITGKQMKVEKTQSEQNARSDMLMLGCDSIGDDDNTLSVVLDMDQIHPVALIQYNMGPKSLTSLLGYLRIEPSDDPSTLSLGSLKKSDITALICYSLQGREVGALEEACALRSSLKKVAGHVARYEWSNAHDLQRNICIGVEDLSDDCSLLFLCVMSHGSKGAFHGPDGVMVPVNKLINQISQVIPDSMNLVVLVQACQDDTTRSASEPSQSALHQLDARDPTVHSTSIDLVRPNTVLLRATSSGGKALRGAYTKAMAAEISKSDGCRDLHMMHVSAVKSMWDENRSYLDEIKQLPQYTDTLKGHLLILPKAIE